MTGNSPCTSLLMMCGNTPAAIIPTGRRVAEIDAESDIEQEPIGNGIDQCRGRSLITAQYAVRHRRIDMAQNVTRTGDRQDLRQQRTRLRAARLVDLEQ